MEEKNKVSQQNGLNNELTLLNSYTESLQNVLKIEEELLTLRKKSTNKINLLNNQINVHLFKKKSDHKVSDDNVKIVNSKSQNGLSYNQLTNAPVRDVPTKVKPNKLEPKFNNEFHYNRTKLANNSDCESVCLLNENEKNDSLCVSKFYSQLNDETHSDSSLNTSNLMDINETQFSNDVENVSNFSKKLNSLYAHLIKQYIRDEKLLSKYFEVMYNVREKAALSMAKNELTRLKMQKTHANDQSSSFRKKQRALLMKLHHEYNEIIFMKNFQKKLSDDRKKILLRQLKHFRTMFINDIERKSFYLKRSCIPHRGKGEKSPLKCYNMTIKDTAHNNYSFSNFSNDKLDNLANLHLSLRKNTSQLEIIGKDYDSSSLKDSDEKSIHEISEKVVNDLICLDDPIKIIDQNILYATKNKMHYQHSADCPKLGLSEIVPATETSKVNVKEEQEIETSEIFKCSKKQSKQIELIEERNFMLTDFILDISTFNFNYALHNAIHELFRIQNNNFATPNRLTKFLFSALANANLNCFVRVKSQNLFEKLFLLQNSMIIRSSHKNQFIAKDNVICLLRSMFEILFMKKNIKNIAISLNETDRKVVTTLNILLTSLLENLNEDDKFLFDMLKSNYFKINKQYRNIIKFNLMSPSGQSSKGDMDPESKNVVKFGIIPSNSTNNQIDKIKCLKNVSIDKTEMKTVFSDNDNSHLNKTLVFPKENSEIKRQRTLKDKPNVVNDDPLSINFGRNSKVGTVNKSYQNEEAEELRKKQLAVEMEIKELLEQQTTQIPYFVVREIPDKPPPPYIPPTEDKISTGTSTDLFVDDEPLKTDQICEIIQLCYENIWLPFLAKEYVDDVDAINNFKTQCELYHEKSLPVANLFLFDLCNELFCSKFKDRNKMKNLWDYQGYTSSLKKIDICKTVEDLANQCLRYDTTVPKDNIFINCAHKHQDHVDELLIKELQDEEPEWVNVEEYEVTIKKSVTDYILNAMISDTIVEFKSLYENK